MASTSTTQTHQPSTWLAPTICVTYGMFVFFIGCVVAKHISIFLDKALRKLPTRFQERTFVRDTLKVLIVVLLSLLWPLSLITIVFTIAGHQIENEQTEEASDLERGDSHFESDELQWNETHENQHPAPPYIDSPPYVASPPTIPSPAHFQSPAGGDITQLPPAYAPYPSVLATLQTQWLQTSDRNAERYICLLNDSYTRAPAEMIQAGTRVMIIPRRR